MRQTLRDSWRMSLSAEIGEALYGWNWQRRLARELGIAHDTCWRWGRGQTLPDQAVMYRLLGMLEAKHSADAQLLRRVRKGLKSPAIPLALELGLLGEVKR